MKARTYLMSFERLVEFLQDNGISIDGRLAMSLPAPPSRLVCSGQAVVLSNDLFEKFFGTWWEVELSIEDHTPLRCFYLADSLQDAFRLRPEIDVSYWCDAEEDTDQFLSEVCSWQGDEYCFE